MRTYNIKPTESDFIVPIDTTHIAVDIETTGLCPITDEIVGISWSYGPDKGYYTQNVADIALILANNTPKIFHNAVFDLKFLKHNKYVVNGTIYDTMILAKLVDQDRKTLKLKELTAMYFDDGHISKAKIIWKWLADNGLSKGDLSQAPYAMLAEYAVEDVLNTYKLFTLFTEKLIKIRKYLNDRDYVKSPIDIYLEEDSKIIPVVVDMELSGVKIDLEQTAKLQLQYICKQKELKANFPRNEHIEKVEDLLLERKIAIRKSRNKTGIIKKIPPRPVFNWGSNDQLKTLFYDVLGEKPLKFTKKGNASIDSDVLETLSHKYDWIKGLLEYKKLDKLVTTYLTSTLARHVGGRMYANFNITGTATGRFSSSKPNFQNIPRDGGIKKIFIPEKGNVFVYADYSQLELRIAAHLSKDELLINNYKNNLDLHVATAAIVFNKAEDAVTDDERQVGKTINFAIIYNAGGYRIADELGYLQGIDPEDRSKIMTQVKRGDVIRKRLLGKYSGLSRYIQKNMSILEKYSLAVTQFGRARMLPDIRHELRGKRNHALKAGFNTYIQSFGASITKRAMIDIHGAGYKIVNQVHDAIYVECPIVEAEFAKKQVQKMMEGVITLDVPLIAEPKLLQSFSEADILDEQISKQVGKAS